MVLALVLSTAGALAAPAARADATLPPAQVRAAQTGLWRPDRVQHAGLALALGLGVGIARGEPSAAAIVPAVLGLGKEFADGRRDRFDALDLAADLAGATLAAVLTAQLVR
jgi:hypothetical protein